MEAKCPECKMDVSAELLGNHYTGESQSPILKIEIRLRVRLHTAFSVASLMYDEPFDAKACNIAVRQKTPPNLFICPIRRTVRLAVRQLCAFLPA
jgi:hypothetical protein